jgi:LacI family transcriptional regulator
MGTTIKDVAGKAGVSIATVSRALNGSPLVTDETRGKIIKLANELKYTPNMMARGLMLKKSETIGVILPDLHGDFFSEVMKGIDEIARENGYHILVSSSHSDKTEIESMLKVMRSGRVDGLIIMSPHLDSTSLNDYITDDLPVVLLNCSIGEKANESIIIDNFNGAKEMVRHLIKHGHKRIAIIKGEENNFDAEERLKGYRSALYDAGLELNPKLELPGNFNEETGYTAMKKILNLKPRPTAVFASNDAMAIGAISAIQGKGLRIPEDIAIGGFDDVPITKYLKPSLSSVHVPIYDLGTNAASKLIRLIKNENNIPEEKIVLRTTLIVRESCGCL